MLFSSEDPEIPPGSGCGDRILTRSGCMGDCWESQGYQALLQGSTQGSQTPTAQSHFRVGNPGALEQGM